MTRLLLLCLLSAGCQPDVPDPDSSKPVTISISLTAFSEHAVDHAYVSDAAPFVAGEARLTAGESESGTPYLTLDASLVTSDTLDRAFSRTMSVSLTAALPDSAISVADRSIASGAYLIATPPDVPRARIETGWRRSLDWGTEGRTIQTPYDQIPTGTLTVDSVRAGIAYGTYETESRPGEASSARPVIKARGQYRAPLVWRDELAEDVETANDRPADGQP